MYMENCLQDTWYSLSGYPKTYHSLQNKELISEFLWKQMITIFLNACFNTVFLYHKTDTVFEI